MNATKFVVLLLIGVLCANVGARQLGGVSKDTKLSISLPKTSTKGVGAELSATAGTGVYVSQSTSTTANRSPRGPGSTTGGSQYIGINGYVNSDGRNAYGSTTAAGGGKTSSTASASPNRASGRTTTAGGGTSSARGSTKHY